MSVHFEDNSKKVMSALESAILEAIQESGVMIQNEANATSGGNNYSLEVDEYNHTATISGSGDKANVDEFGKGEYSLAGKDKESVDRHKGSIAPKRSLSHAFVSKKNAIQKNIESKLKDLG